MTIPALTVLSVGMVSGVGLTAPAACAAIRCAIDNFQEIRFIDSGGEWIVGCSVPLEQAWRGRTKLLKMLVLAVQECGSQVRQLDFRRVPLLLCLAEPERPGRLADLDNSLLTDLQTESGLSFHPHSQVIAEGRVSGIEALRQARHLIEKENVSQVMIAGVDSFLVAATLKAYEEQEKLLTSQNSDGFLPGEAAGAILVGYPLSKKAEPQLSCVGLGMGIEPAFEGSELPLRADGLVEAIRGALGEVGCDLGVIDFRITDAAGGQYNFKEAALALTRLLRKRKEKFDIWHPADCIGEVGAATVPIIIIVAWFACRKGYAEGPKILGHVGNDQGKRGAWILSYQ